METAGGSEKNFIHTPKIMLASPKSGSGKTTVTCALLYALKKRGLCVRAFKCGPDYIDPMFHRKVLGIPSVNLDVWFTGREGTARLFEEHMSASGARCPDMGVIEGVMGLYDGLGGITQKASSYELACILKAPVILIIDARGTGYSLIPQIRGFLSMDREHLIRGVLLNRTSESFMKQISPVIQKECGIPVVGCLPRDDELRIDSRHLGLKLPDEISALRRKADLAADLLEKSADIDAILEIAGSEGTRLTVHKSSAPEAAPPFVTADMSRVPLKDRQAQQKADGCDRVGHASRIIRIAVASDEAFCFYYEDNLYLLERLGCEIVLFSPLRDRALPENIDGLYLGGGYPELKAAQLSENHDMLRSVAASLRAGMPSIAECGGFMYLHERMETPDGDSYPMAGAVRGSCHYTGKLVRFGYCSITEHQPVFLPEGRDIRGHEFHYYDSDDSGSDCTAMKPVSGLSWDCVHRTDHSWWGYPHLYWMSAPGYAEHFVQCCR